MIVDCFTFFNELELLEIRLNVLNDVVDRFVLVESSLTFQGRPKPLYYDENKAKFSKFADRIDHVIVDDFTGVETSSPWEMEYFQRNQIKRGIQHLSGSDVVLLSDVDELPKPEHIAQANSTRGISVFRHDCFYYFLNCRALEHGHPLPSYGTVMSTKRAFDKLGAQRLRQIAIDHNVNDRRPTSRAYRFLKYTNYLARGMPISVLADGGWHFSFLGGVDRIVKKIEAFAHDEFNHPEYKDREKLLKTINDGKDLFGRHYEYEQVQLDERFPGFILHNKERFQALILK